ncbi:hypothetical protein BN1723_020382, partial [Verticillium longisporum]
MDRMERSNGPRGLPDNPAQGVRRLPMGNSLPPPMPPMPNIRNTSSSNATLSASTPISSAQVIALAREAMQNALRENESQAAEASAVSNDLKPGVTIDL